jgi:hypothetical protein
LLQPHPYRRKGTSCKVRSVLPPGSFVYTGRASACIDLFSASIPGGAYFWLYKHIPLTPVSFLNSSPVAPPFP